MEAERAVELAPNDAGAHAARGFVLAQQGQFLEATRAVKRALRLDPRSGPGGNLLMIAAYVNYGAGRRAEAIDLLERVRLASPDNVTVRVTLTGFYGQAGHREEARAAAREALRVTPDLTTERAMQLIPAWEAIVDPEEFARYPDYLRTAGLP